VHTYINNSSFIAAVATRAVTDTVRWKSFRGRSQLLPHKWSCNGRYTYTIYTARSQRYVEVDVERRAQLDQRHTPTHMHRHGHQPGGPGTRWDHEMRCHACIYCTGGAQIKTEKHSTCKPIDTTVKLLASSSHPWQHWISLCLSLHHRRSERAMRCPLNNVFSISLATNVLFNEVLFSRSELGSTTTITMQLRSCVLGPWDKTDGDYCWVLFLHISVEQAAHGVLAAALFGLVSFSGREIQRWSGAGEQRGAR
jgi:hypothetical protein